MPPKKRASSPVPDDWEDDDSDEGPKVDEERNRRIWEEANTKVPAPMPTIVTTSASSVNPLPPPAAFQPTLRILKRPSPSSSTPSTPGLPSGTSTPDANLKEREARYQAARERIFGGAEQAAASASACSHASNGNGSRVAREPRGPGESQDQGSDNKGFAHRRGSNKAVSSSVPPTSEQR